MVQVHLMYMWFVVPCSKVIMILTSVLILSRLNLLIITIEMLKTSHTRIHTIRGREIIQILGGKIKTIHKGQLIRWDSNQDNHRRILNRICRLRWKNWQRFERLEGQLDQLTEMYRNMKAQIDQFANIINNRNRGELLSKIEIQCYHS